MYSTLKKSYNAIGSDLLPDVGVRVVNYPARAERIQLIQQLNRTFEPICKQIEFISLRIRYICLSYIFYKKHKICNLLQK